MAYIKEFQGYLIKDEEARKKLAKLYFNNVNDLKNNTNLIAGDVVKTLGYYDVFDGGSGLYVITDTCPDNTADEIEYISLQNNLFARLRIENKTIKVKQMGVRENESIKSAIEYCNTKGLDLFLNGSKFICEHVTPNISIYSNGCEVEFTETYGFWYEGEDITIDGVVFNHNYVADSISVIIRANSKNVTIKNCKFKNPGFECLGTGESIQENLLITECTFEDYGRFAIALVGCDGVKVINNTFFDGVENSAGCIDIEPYSAGQTCKNVVIENNRFIHSKNGISFSGYSGCTYGNIKITSNLFETLEGIRYNGRYTDTNKMPSFNVNNNIMKCTSAILVTSYDTIETKCAKLFKLVDNDIVGSIQLNAVEVVVNSNRIECNTEIQLTFTRCCVDGNSMASVGKGFLINGRNLAIYGSMTNNVFLDKVNQIITLINDVDGSILSVCNNLNYGAIGQPAHTRVVNTSNNSIAVATNYESRGEVNLIAQNGDILAFTSDPAYAFAIRSNNKWYPMTP